MFLCSTPAGCYARFNFGMRDNVGRKTLEHLCLIEDSAKAHNK